MELFNFRPPKLQPCPILDAQSGDSFEFLQIIGDYDQPEGAGMAGNHLVVGADWPANLCQLCPDHAGMGRAS